MYSSFDLVVEVSLDQKAEKDFITVGWGKKETQFHGSLGKEGRKQEIESRSKIKANEAIDKSINCCWRGDGEYFVVSHVGENGRMFKVYTKEGVCEFCSELCANLQSPLAWKPSGLWICKPEVYPQKYVITLFERNGLKHNELLLPFSYEEEVVVKLSWSHDSDILLIETKKKGTSKHNLYFYTINNYHWYLKYSMSFDEKILTNWNQNYTDPKQLFILSSSGEFTTLNFDFCINSSVGSQENDKSVVAVIDGKNLLLTSFATQIVPPPMFSLKYEHEKNLNIVGFLQGNDDDPNSFAVLDEDNSIKFIHYDDTCKITRKIDLPMDQQVTSLLWISKKYFLLSNKNQLNLFSTESGELLQTLTASDSIGLMARRNSREFYIELNNAEVKKITITEEGRLESEDHIKLEEFCEKLIFTSQGVCFGLKTFSKKLYCDTKELATEVTSVCLTDDERQLMYTTISQLNFIDLMKPDMKVIATRRVERGSKIVIQVSNKSQVIVQLPRGNLETILPRILSLKIVKKFMKVKKYREAFDLMRKERMNLNLLVDLDPLTFLEDVNMFIEQIDNPQWLNLFITELKNEDVTKSMQFCDDDQLGKENFDFVGKPDKICHLFLDIFKRDSQKYCQPSITCLVKMSGHDHVYIEDALFMIWEMVQSNKNDSATESFNYLLYLIDINRLYNIALGTYDFKLVLYVAQKSQMDPKEYIPFLNELNNYEPAFAKFRIDCFLKRFEKAIASISEICDRDEMFDKCLEIVKKHSLYKKALEVFKDNEERRNALNILFGDHLRVQGKIYEASVMYERGNDLQQSFLCARKILDWRRCFLLALKLNYTHLEIQELASKLIQALKETGNFADISEISKKYSNTFDDYLESLLDGNFFARAIFEVASEKKIEYMPKIKTTLQRYLQSLVDSIENDKRSYMENKDRLLKVREEKLVKYQNSANINDDTFSETSSVQSQSSRQTFRSSKNKRKHEKKLLNLKEGNKFEDVALVDLLWKLVQKIIGEDMQNLIKETLCCAANLNIQDEAKLLQVTV